MSRFWSLALVCLLTACTVGGRAVSAESLIGTWQIDAIDGVLVPGADPARPLTVAFTAGSTEGAAGAVSGYGGVNRYNGSCTITGGHLAIGGLIATRRAGPEADMQVEGKLLQAVGESTTWSITAGRLVLTDVGGHERVRAHATTSEATR